MPLAYPQNSPTFDPDHRPVYKVNYWDTVYTPESAGVEFSLFTLVNGIAFESVVGAAPQAVAHATIEAQLDAAAMESVLGYDENEEYVRGVAPNVYKYWGTGAPPGVAKAKATVMKFRGDVKQAGQTTLVFGGQGRIQVYVNQTEILRGELREPLTDPEITTSAQFQDEAGYLMVAHTFSQGDDLEIYYWHNGEPWGGLFAKGLAGNQVTNYDPLTIRRLLRDAPILGASFFGVEAGGTDLTATELPYLEEFTVSKDRDSAAKAQVQVALTTSDQPDGYHWDAAQNALVDNASGLVVRQDRRVELQAGYAEAGALKTALGAITADLYPRLTGHISKIQPSNDMSTATIHCIGFENLMLQSFDENYPDRLSYLSNGYIFREGGHEPVYHIPAFDNWPLETAISEYCYRSGIDAKYLGKDPLDVDPDFGRMEIQTASTETSHYVRKLFAARYLANDDKCVRIERNTAYGNVGALKKDYLPADDEYLFTPSLSDRCFDQATEIVEHYGYSLVFDSKGRGYLRPGDNADEFIPILDPSDASPVYTSATISLTNITTETISPDAVTGVYAQKSTGDAAWAVEIVGEFSRLDLYAGVGSDGTTNGGVIGVEIEVWNGSSWDPYSIGAVSTYRPLAGNEQENLAFFYDDVLNADGTNAAVFSLMHVPFDRYRVTLTPNGLDAEDIAATASYRINGFGVYYVDPKANVLPVAFATDTNVFSMQPESGHENLRNHIIVVGARKGIVTDSQKFTGENTNPQNLEAEFHLEIASDPNSIYNPGATNFVGNKRIAVVYDEKVADSDFARWLAVTALYKYRNPNYKVPLDTIAVPMLELGDSVAVYEAKHQMVDHVVWVQSFEETWTTREASARITTSSYPDIASYKPREDLDIDALFDGLPAINMEIEYTNLMGVVLTNTDLAAPDLLIAPETSEVMTSYVSQALTNPALPETIALFGESSDTNVVESRFLVNHPYRKFWHIDGWSGAYAPTLDFDFEEGDGGNSAYDPNVYYRMPNVSPVTWRINYRMFDTRSTENPFYDPYSSELGHLVSVKFDALISGRYRVSIWDARKSGGAETPVAWLTNPTAEPMDPAAHWTYMEPQSEVEFLWDGVDNIGAWNRQQSASYAQRIAGAFGEEAVAVANGFYVWNDDSTDIKTQIGDAVADNYRTGGDVREAGFPFFTMGKYGQFYVKVEVWNDELAVKDAGSAGGTVLPRIVSTEELNTTHNSAEAAFIWTHLGEPNQIDISIEEWDSSVTEYTLGSQADNWAPLGTSEDAVIRNGKPVRMSFSPRPRPGILFGEDSSFTSAGLTRQVHLQTTVFDQFWTFYNQSWEGIDTTNIRTNEKRLTSRMFHNNDHTMEWKDSGFRNGAEISAAKWVFQPNMFKMDFGRGYEEVLQYGDYEQLEVLPGHRTARQGGAHVDQEAYMNLAFLNYLFYFSAYSIDRSGRRQWMLNREFIDKSKISTSDWLASTYALNPENAVDQELKGADLYLKRTIFTREWLDPHWASGGARTPLSPVNANHDGTGGITDAYELEWVQFSVSDLDPQQATLTSAPADEHRDTWLEAYATNDTQVNWQVRQFAAHNESGRTIDGVTNFNIRPHVFNSWNFQRGPQTLPWYHPSPKVDFHPYWTQGMPNWHSPHTNLFVAGDASINQSEGKLPAITWGSTVTALSYMHILTIPSSMRVKALRDPKGQENWFGYAFSAQMSGSVDFRGVRLEQSVAGWAADRYQVNLQYAFDYVKQDRLNRYEHFRGLWGRGPYEYRDDTYANYTDRDQPRYGPRQNLKPSGVYFMNLGRYTDFITGPAHTNHHQEFQHWTRGISDWYDIRFRHEYVWYNDRHFPVTGQGTSQYGRFREEYTNAREILGIPPFLRPASTSISQLYFDPGAWVGWKDDIPRTGDTKWAEDWTTAPVLRWGDAAYRGMGTWYQGERFPWDSNSGTQSKPYSSGGYNYGAGTVHSTAYTDLPLSPGGVPVWWLRRNIFDDATGDFGLFTLAVGPELDESRTINMNLVLPTNLRS